jgi:hypothetical protein
VVGGWIRFAVRKLAGGNCRDEVVVALGTLRSGAGADAFTVRDVNAEIAQARTRHAESTVFKAKQRMKASPWGEEGKEFEMAIGRFDKFGHLLSLLFGDRSFDHDNDTEREDGIHRMDAHIVADEETVKAADDPHMQDFRP